MNKGALATVTGLMALTIGLACGGGSSYDNVGACKNYVQSYNDLSCMAVDLNADDMCPASLDMTPCDLATYYNCMADAMKCNGDIPDISGQMDCGSPTC